MAKSEKLPSFIIVLDDDENKELQHIIDQQQLSCKKIAFIYIYAITALMLCFIGIIRIVVENDQKLGIFLLIIGLSLCSGTLFIKF